MFPISLLIIYLRYFASLFNYVNNMCFSGTEDCYLCCPFKYTTYLLLCILH